MTLRVRLLLSFALVVVITAVSVVIAFRLGAANEVRVFMNQSGMTGLTELAGELESYFNQTGSWVGADMLIPRRGSGMMGGGMMGQRIRLAAPDGTVLIDSRGTAAGTLSASELLTALALKDARGHLIGYLLGEGGMGGPNSEVLLARLTVAAILGGLIGGVVALVIGLALSVGLLRPVRQLNDAAIRMARGNLDQQVEARGSDELAQLGKSFNSMASSLKRSEENRKAMTADIAHELRTPIAVQRAHLEALQDGVYPLTGENLQPVLDQTETLARLVEDLRTLALADAGELALEINSLEAQSILQRVIERFKPEADARKIRLVSQVENEPLTLLGDSRRVEQILNNLVSNALRYTPEEGVVSMLAKRMGRRVCISVQDTGPGIPVEALPHVFDRFFRADRARSREEGGTGLGLAIAKQLAQAQGGHLSVENSPGSGAAFTLDLPAE